MGLEVGVLGGVGVADFADVGQEGERRVGFLGEQDLFDVMVRAATGRPVRRMDVVFIVEFDVGCRSSVFV